MDREQRASYIKTRVGRYMAQILEEYERLIEPRVPTEVSEAFKPVVRRKLSALGADCIELDTLDDQVFNGAARDLKDQVDPDASRAAATGG